MRVYEFSKQFNLTNKQVLDALQHAGYVIQSHMSALDSEALQFLKNHFGQQEIKKPSKKEPEGRQEISRKPQVLKEIRKEPAVKEPEKSKPTKAPEKLSHHPEIESGEIVLEPTLLSDLAQKIKKPANELILYLLKRGIACTKNELLSIEQIKDIAHCYGIPTKEPQLNKGQRDVSKRKERTEGEFRLPVIVIMGHVDHGKTTLLDFIRKSRVALREKGGITQHLGAYEVNTSHGSLIFLDTPGHEAFTRIRARGANIADIAVLVVAADDGVMPQTVEAIKHAEAVGIPIIVAINKIDKATPAQIESTKRQLAQHDLLPEEWGGQTVCIPISAKAGTGVDQLLELVALQAELMELKTDTKIPAKGFILEAKLERGRGPVATLILYEGVLRIGDFFIAEGAYGRVNALIDSYGKSLKQVGPSIPVQVSGFDKLPEAGAQFSVVPQQEYKKIRASKGAMPVAERKPPVSGEGFNVIIKADNKSSKEALIGSLEKIARKVKREINIIHAALGDVSEGDVSLAYNTGAIIYGFQVKIESKAAALAKRDRVTVKLYGIIYQLLDDVQEAMTQKKEVKTQVLVGTAEVRKVFSIKGIGVIAGCYVTDGILSRNGRIVALRKDKKIGEGSIKSLERDRKPVKEVHKGYECAFLIDGFDDWQVGDVAQCYLEKIVQE